jgi:hypothetical protein
MADDQVLVIVGTETPPANYKTAHPIGDGEKVILTPPEGGCVVYFTATPSKVEPDISPTNGIYSLPYVEGADNSVKFKFNAAAEQTILYQVGPPPSLALTASELNPQAHTVIIGSTKPE